MNEFDVINKYFLRRQFKRSDVIVAIGDDAAVVEVPKGYQMAVSIDCLVENVHFFKNTSAKNLGYKAVAVSLSDIAAMGATPVWVTLSLILPQIDEMWLQDFCDGMYPLLNHYHIELIGGNTTRGPLTITTQLHGLVESGSYVTRAGAKMGDYIFVTGNLGDAGLGLAVLQQRIKVSTTHADELIEKHNRPTARVEQGIAIGSIANSAIDISDGLLSDLNHILVASNVGATVFSDLIPLSSTYRFIMQSEVNPLFAMTAGEDYELCFTVDPDDVDQLKEIFMAFSCKLTHIGIIENQHGLRVLDSNKKQIEITRSGFDHFG